MLHNEELKDGWYEIRHNNDDEAIHIYILNEKKAFVFPTLDDLVRFVYLGDKSVEHKVVNDDELSELYDSEYYSYEELFEDEQE